MRSIQYDWCKIWGTTILDDKDSENSVLFSWRHFCLVTFYCHKARCFTSVTNKDKLLPQNCWLWKAVMPFRPHAGLLRHFLTSSFGKFLLSPYLYDLLWSNLHFAVITGILGTWMFSCIGTESAKERMITAGDHFPKNLVYHWKFKLLPFLLMLYYVISKSHFPVFKKSLWLFCF